MQVNVDTNSVTQAVLADADRTAIGDEEAAFCLQNVFTGNIAAASYSIVQQRIENVRRLANKTVTVSFWAKAAAGTPLVGVTLDQYFGTGGSPSAQVNNTGLTVTLSTAWTRYNVTRTLPSISGKVLGTNLDSFTILSFWFSSGSTNSAHSGGVNVQSGTVQLWGVQLEVASGASILEKPDPRYELHNCQRFFQGGPFAWYGYGAAGQFIGHSVPWAVAMRGVPTIVLSSTTYTNCTAAASQLYTNGWVALATATATGAASMQGNFTASADL
jgi:hypothetical protein